MPIYTSSVSPKGQVTIPAEIREQFQIQPRDRGEFMVIDRKIVVVPSMERLRAGYGSVPRLDPSRSWEEIETIAKEEAVERNVVNDLRTRSEQSS